MKILSIIIPAYNEIDTLELLLQKVDAVIIDGFAKQVIIVDDCSTDGTRQFLNELDRKNRTYTICYHAENHGKGRAIRTGLEYAKGKYTIIQDADLEYDPEDYRSLLHHAEDNNLPVVYGSRRLKKKNEQHSSFLFFIGGKVVTWTANILYGINLTDEPTCYKLIKTDLLKDLKLTCEGFEFCPEVTAKIAKKKIPIPELPISYYPRNVDEGKKIRWIDGIEAILTLIKWKIKREK